MSGEPGPRPNARRPEGDNVILFDGRMSQQGYRLNSFARSICDAANRARFLADEDAYARDFGLGAEERRWLADRNWLAMVRHGGNMYALIKVARCLGIPQTVVGASMRGESHEDFLATRPPGPTGLSRREDLD